MTRSTTRDLHLVAALLILAACCAGCDQFMPYDKVPVRVCGVVDSIYAETDSTVYVGSGQLCYTDWRREVPAPTWSGPPEMVMPANVMQLPAVSLWQRAAFNRGEGGIGQGHDTAQESRDIALRTFTGED